MGNDQGDQELRSKKLKHRLKDPRRAEKDLRMFLSMVHERDHEEVLRWIADVLGAVKKA